MENRITNHDVDNSIYSIDNPPTRPNLLHNWHFKNPINRNGLTEYVDTVILFDRWRKSHNGNELVVKVNEGYVTLTNDGTEAFRYMYQYLNRDLTGETCTLSAIVRGAVGGRCLLRLGGMRDGSIAITNLSYFNMTGDWMLITATGVMPENSTNHMVMLYPDNIPNGTPLDVLAVKLELGDKQTLAHQDAEGNWVLNEIPDYAEQMAICMQYDKTTGAYTGITASDVGARPDTWMPTASDVGAAEAEHTHSEYAASSHNHSASNITSGTLGVARGGTGATTFTSGQALIGAGTGAVTTRAITNNTSATSAITGSTNLVTMNTLKNAMNRATAPSSADTSYGTAMVRAIKASTTDLTAGTSDLTSGTIYIVYE